MHDFYFNFACAFCTAVGRSYNVLGTYKAKFNGNCRNYYPCNLYYNGFNSPFCGQSNGMDGQKRIKGDV